MSARVIARRVSGKRRYLNDPQWATPILTSMVEKGRLEVDAQGHYRLKKVDPAERSNRTFVSPQMRQILERSSKSFSHVIHIDTDEDELD